MNWKQVLRRRPSDAEVNPSAIECVTWTHEDNQDSTESINIITASMAKEKLNQHEWLPSWGIYGKQVERSWVVKSKPARNWN